jgi:Threonine dehydrogenase and related Zn-dependent dehydrogenases
MRALQLADFGRMAVIELPEPTAGAGEVILEIVATGICGSDVHGFTGENGRRVIGQVMGHESVGRVISLGEGVDPTAVPVGAVATFNPVLITAERRERFAGREQHDPERIIIGVDTERISAFAHRIVVPVENIVLLPEHMPISYGALIEPFAVGLNAVRRARVAPGESVLVVGGGPIGQSAVLAALREGAGKVYVSEPFGARRELCASLGAIAIDPRKDPVIDQIVALNGGPVDVAIDAVGISESLEDALGATVFGGRVCLVGMGQPGLTIDAYLVSTAERSIIGSFCYSFDTFATAAAIVGGGDEVFGRLISAEVGLDDAPATFERLAAAMDMPGKALVRFDL